MKQRVRSLFLLALGTPTVVAAQGGRVAMPVLLLPASARALALGGAGAPLISDDAAIFYNPALMQGQGVPVSVSGSYQAYVESSSLSALSAAFSVGRTRVGAGIQLLDYGSSPEIIPDPGTGGERGTPTGAEVSAVDLAFTLAVSRTVARRGVLGASVKLLREQVAGEASNAGAVDVGLVVPLHGVVLTVAGQNLDLGSGIALAGREAALPELLRVGAFVPLFAWERSAIAGVGEVMQVSRVGLTRIAALEGTWVSSNDVLFALRAGYRSEPGTTLAGPLTFGGGVQSGRLRVDYGYQGLRGLAGTHRFGARWRR
jgi:hypothetical protein